MADFTYTPVSGKLKRFFQHVQSAGIPNKVTSRYLASVGFKSRNDRTIIAVLKFIDFVDASGVPTQRWRDYRNKDRSKKVLAAAVRGPYAGLFSLYSDAHRKDNEALRNFFSSHTDVGQAALQQMVQTFKALADLSDFESADLEEHADLPEAEADTSAAGRQPGSARGAHGITININLQLELPTTEKSEIYDALFAAMKKHLLS